MTNKTEADLRKKLSEFKTLVIMEENKCRLKQIQNVTKLSKINVVKM